MSNHPTHNMKRRNFLGRRATFAAAGIGTSLSSTRLLGAEKEDKAKALIISKSPA